MTNVPRQMGGTQEKEWQINVQILPNRRPPHMGKGK
jgi:hypothetical protein